jgi:7SK snRNA methylphosphate capping enzyme
MEGNNTLINKKRERDENSKLLDKKDILELEHVDTGNLNPNSISDVLNEISSNEDFWNKIKSERIPDILVKDKTFSFGNYNRLYYKKYLESMKDERLGVLKKDWFEDKKCLDIGCNDGTLTLMIGLLYEPKIIEGIDIDYRLIKTAVKNMKSVARNNLSDEYIHNLILADESNRKDNNIVEQILGGSEDRDHTEHDVIVNRIKTQLKENQKVADILNKLKSLPTSFVLPKQPYGLDLLKNDNNIVFPSNVIFRQENFVDKIQSDEGIYDTIVCLSTAKWIHLNYGDIGIKLMFYNIYRQLKIDGLFIFEFQCWKSYKKRKDLNNNIKKNFNKIKMKPDRFKEYLQCVYGYQCVEVTNPPSNAKKTYDRPIYVFKKVK